MYTIVPQTPPLDARELDSVESAVEIVILWGDLSVLHVAHLSPPRSFYVGESAADFTLGAQVLGASRLPIVLVEDGAANVVIPAAASGELDIGGEAVGFDALAEQGLLRPVPGSAGARSYPLSGTTGARIQLGELRFIVRPVAAAVRIAAAGRADFEWSRHRWTLVSSAVHLALLGLFYLLPPHAVGMNVDTLNRDSRLVSYAIMANQPPPEPLPEWVPSETGAAAPGGGARARDDAGKAGKPDAPKVAKRMSVAGPPDNPDPYLARQLAQRQAVTAGIIGILKSSPWAAQATLFNAEQASGYDPENVVGQLFGPQIGESWGFSGLGAHGPGRGGGGDASGTIGTGALGTRGLGGDGPGGVGYGGHGTGGFRERSARVPRVRTGTVDAFGSLSREVIRRVINRHINEVRHCYTQQLQARPDLQGRVAVKFIIAPTGMVQTAAVVDSDVGNASLTSCVAAAVKRWSFPAPEGGGVVVVTYPFLFSAVGD